MSVHRICIRKRAGSRRRCRCETCTKDMAFFRNLAILFASIIAAFVLIALIPRIADCSPHCRGQACVPGAACGSGCACVQTLPGLGVCVGR